MFGNTGVAADLVFYTGIKMGEMHMGAFCHFVFFLLQFLASLSLFFQTF